MFDDIKDDISGVQQTAENIKDLADRVKASRSVSAAQPNNPSAKGGAQPTQAAAGQPQTQTAGQIPQTRPAAKSAANSASRANQAQAAGTATRAGKSGAAAAASQAGATAGAGAGAASTSATTAGAATGAVGGPVGAVAGAALGKVGGKGIKFILILALLLLVIVVMIITSLPRMIFGPIFSLEIEAVKTESMAVQDAAIQVIAEAYSEAFNKIVAQAKKNNHDIDLTLENIEDLSGGATNVDMAYTMAAYSVSMGNYEEATGEDMLAKLKGIELYKFDTEVQTKEIEVPVEIDEYEAYEFTIATSDPSTKKDYYQLQGYVMTIEPEGFAVPIYEAVNVRCFVNGIIKTVRYYQPTGKIQWHEPFVHVEIPVYKKVTVTIPQTPKTEVMTGYKLSGTQVIDIPTTVQTYELQEFDVLLDNNKTKKEKHLVAVGEELVEPEIQTVTYLKSVIYPIQKEDIDAAFGIDPYAVNDPETNAITKTNITNKQVIDNMIGTYMLLLEELGVEIYRSYSFNSGYDGVPIEAPNFEKLYPGLVIPACSDNRLFLLEIGATLVGRVDYWFGGNHGSNYCHPGWNDAWGTPKKLYAGSRAGQTMPYGLDCSGFVKWAYSTAFGYDVFGRSDYTGSMIRNVRVRTISIDQLQPGDLGLDDGHVGIFAGFNQKGQRIWLHSRGVMQNADDIAFTTRNSFKYFRRVTVVEDRLQGNDLRQEADLMTRMGIAIASDKNDIDYTLPEYAWLSGLSNQPEIAKIKYQKEYEIRYYCMCSDCTGLDEGERAMTATGQQYRTGIVACNSLPTGTNIGLFGKMFIVQDKPSSIQGVDQAADNVIYVYLPRHSLLNDCTGRLADVPVYQ